MSQSCCKNQYFTVFQMCQCTVFGEQFCHCAKYNGCLNHRFCSLLTECVGKINGIHHSCQHTDLVCFCSVHGAVSTSASPEVTAAYHQTYLCSHFHYLTNLFHQTGNDCVIEGNAFLISCQCFSAQFQHNSLIHANSLLNL